MAADFVRHTVHVARKAVRCTHCGRLILPGERYRRSAGCFEILNGQMATHRACGYCVDLGEAGSRGE
jgi:hypothetical protein